MGSREVWAPSHFHHAWTLRLFGTCPARLVLEDSLLLSSLLILFFLPHRQEVAGVEKLDHLGLWEGLAELGLDSGSAGEA